MRENRSKPTSQLSLVNDVVSASSDTEKKEKSLRDAVQSFIKRFFLQNSPKTSISVIVTMSVDSAWIFRICLVMAVNLILFADFLGYGGANARKSDKSEDYEDYTAEDHHRPNIASDKGMNTSAPIGN